MTDIALAPDLDRFVRSQVEAGRFRDPSDVIAAGLHLLEEAVATQAEHRDHLLASMIRAPESASLSRSTGWQSGTRVG